jgi:hypothetical protein
MRIDIVVNERNMYMHTGTYKVRNETKRNQRKRNETKGNQQKQNEINEMKTKAKRNQRKQNEID